MFDNYASWRVSNRTFEYRVIMEENGCGPRFLESESKDGSPDEPQGFIFDEETRTWLSPRLSKGIWEGENEPTAIPLRLVEWCRTFAQKLLKEPTEEGFRKQYFQAPWIQVPHYVKSFLPRCVDLEELESTALNYSFQNGMLLAEAVTHPSAEQASTPSYMRLMLIGKQCIQVLTTQVIRKKLGFPTHTTRIQPMEEIPNEVQESGQTYTVAASRAPTKGGIDELFLFPKGVTISGDQAYPTAEELNKLTNGFDNHVMYAFACVEMGLSKFLHFDSEELDTSIRAFKNFVAAWMQKAETDESKMKTFPIALTLADPPRALSDLFYAVAGAVLLDSDWVNFSRVFETVLLEKLFYDEMWSSMVEMMKSDGENSCDPVYSLEKYAAEKGFALAVRLLPPVPLEEQPLVPEDKESTKVAKEVSSGLRDKFGAAVWLHGVQLQKFEGGNSPRTALRKCAYKVGSGLRETNWDEFSRALDNGKDDIPAAVRGFYTPGRKLEVEKETDEVNDEAKRKAEQSAGAQPQAQESEQKEFYCPHCNMTLNGPTQWEDHKIGKRHRKNTNKAPTKSTMPNPTPHVASIRGDGKPRQAQDGENPPLASGSRVPPTVSSRYQPPPPTVSDRQAPPPPPPPTLSTRASTAGLRSTNMSNDVSNNVMGNDMSNSNINNPNVEDQDRAAEESNQQPPSRPPKAKAPPPPLPAPRPAPPPGLADDVVPTQPPTASVTSVASGYGKGSGRSIPGGGYSNWQDNGWYDNWNASTDYPQAMMPPVMSSYAGWGGQGMGWPPDSSMHGYDNSGNGDISGWQQQQHQ